MTSDPPHDHAAAAPRPARRSPLRTLGRVLLGLFGASCLALFVGWLSLHWLILPHIEEWRGPIEARASKMLGAVVKIGAIEVRSSGWVPALELRQVEVLDAEQRVALSLPRVAASISPRSLLAFEPRFEQLLIDAPVLDIRRDAAGHIRVAGLDFGGKDSGADDGGDAAHWFFKQEEFVIRGGTVRWIDEERQAPPLVLAGVDVVVRNGLRSHDIRLDATPPADWGDRFTIRGKFVQPLFARGGDWRRWSGSMYSELPRADVRELRRYLTLPFELSAGDGALRGWFEVREGRPEAATLDVSLRAVALRLDKRVEALEFEQVEGRFDARKKGDRIAIEARGFGFVTGDGIRWPKGDLSVAWVHPEGEEVTSGEFSAERLDIGVMAGIAGRVPLGAALRTLLADVHPEGVITQLAARWDGPIDAPAHYRVKGKLTGLSLTAHAGERHDAVGRPGLRNATVQLDASEAGGEARIGLEQGVVELPGVFDEPALPFDRLDAKLDWKIERRPGAAPNITVRVREASFANPDAEGELTATWRTGAGDGMARGGRFPGVLELDGRIGNGRATRTVRYLPLGLPDSVRGYVSRSVLDGTIEQASFRVRGDLWDFPFHGGKSGREGEFRIEAKVAGVVFAYIPGEAPASRPAEAGNPNWPSLTEVSGELIIDKTRLEIRDARARLGGADWTGVRGGIPQLGDRARFEIEGTGRGPLSEMLRYVNATPVGRWTGRALASASGSGVADLKLGLTVPLDRPGETQVKGSLALPGNDVRMTPDTPLLGAAKARIDFTQSAFTVAAGSARVLGGDMTFEGGSHGDSQRFTAQGTVTAEALRNAPELGAVARLPVTGQAGYRATLAFVGGQPQLGVTSNLVGMALDLPQPLGKAAPAAVVLRVQSGLDDGAPVGPGREAWRVELGSALQARFLREGAGDGAVVRGAIRLLEPATPPPAEASEPLLLPAAGVTALVAVRRLDVDEWEASADRVFGEPARGAAPASATEASAVAAWAPDQVGLRLGELSMGARRLGNVVAGLTHEGGLWRVNVDSDELDGYVEYRHPRRGASAGGPGGGRVYARLARLNLPKGEAERVESLLDEPPASVPALDIVVDDFELRGKRLGRLEIEAWDPLESTCRHASLSIL